MKTFIFSSTFHIKNQTNISRNDETNRDQNLEPASNTDASDHNLNSDCDTLATVPTQDPFSAENGVRITFDDDIDVSSVEADDAVQDGDFREAVDGSGDLATTLGSSEQSNTDPDSRGEKNAFEHAFWACFFLLFLSSFEH